MNFRTITAGLAAIAVMSGNAHGQDALAKEYGYILASRTPSAAYFVSGIQRGSEPGSIEAWVWTVPHEAAALNADGYDARAQYSVVRCEGKSIELLRTEYYLKGEMTRVVAEPAKLPADVKSGTPMEGVWKIACDRAARFAAQTETSLDEVYRVVNLQ